MDEVGGVNETDVLILQRVVLQLIPIYLKLIWWEFCSIISSVFGFFVQNANVTFFPHVTFFAIPCLVYSTEGGPQAI